MAPKYCRYGVESSRQQPGISLGRSTARRRASWSPLAKCPPKSRFAVVGQQGENGVGQLCPGVRECGRAGWHLDLEAVRTRSAVVVNDRDCDRVTAWLVVTMS